MESVYNQFEKRFNSIEELEEYKEKLPTDNATTEQKLDLQLFGSFHADTETKIAPSVTIADTHKTEHFSTIRQGNATNALTKLKAIEGKNAKIDATGTATITKGNFALTIPNYAKLSGLKTSTYQLLDIITVALTITGAKSPTVIISLDEYMKRRGLKDRKEAKNQVKEDLEVLRQASITGEEKRGKNTQAYSFVNIADSGEIRRNGEIVFTFGNTFYNMLLGYPVMPYPAQLQTINNKKNPNSYYLLRKIAEHKNMNVGKKNEDIIAVKTLLDISPFIPSFEEVKAGNRNIGDRIITPFERDMDALDETLCWHYCHSNGESLTDTELQNFSYEVFSALMIKTEWKNYPDQTARLERKAERAEQVKKTKNNKNSKKKTDKPA
jgi:hypothetical protein